MLSIERFIIELRYSEHEGTNLKSIALLTLYSNICLSDASVSMAISLLVHADWEDVGADLYSTKSDTARACV